MTAAFAITLQGLANELALHGRRLDNLIGEELDLGHGLSFLHHATIKATDQYEDIANSDLVIITAGAAQQPGETRLDLAKKNSAIIEEIIPQVIRYAPEAVILIVSNPVDVLTYKAYQLANLPKGRIFGSGTTLDTARFRFHLSEFLQVNPNSIHAYVLGEHGDSSFPVLSSASVGGQALSFFPRYSEEKAMQAYEKVKTAADKIIQSKGATYYGIGVVVARLAQAVLRDEGVIFPVSIPLHHYYGHNGVALSIPCVIGRSGAEESLEIKLNWDEKRKLDHSVETIKQFLH